MSCPWATIEKPELVNLNEIMKEQSVQQEKGYQNFGTKGVNNENTKINYYEINDRASNSNYRKVLSVNEEDFESEDELYDDIKESKEWELFEKLEREVEATCVHKLKKDKDKLTKVRKPTDKNKLEDSDPSEAQNSHADKIEIDNFELKLPDDFYDNLKVIIKQEQDRRRKKYNKDENTFVEESYVIDQFSRFLMYKLIKHQIIKKYNKVINIGQEAIIIHADGDPSYPFAKEPIPKECVVKIFKNPLSEVKQLNKYIIEGDDHSRDGFGKSTRQIIQLSSRREITGLMRVREAGVKCPKLVKIQNHLVIMEYIGHQDQPAPNMQDAVLDEEDYISVYNQIIEGMKNIYTKASLILADLTERNILWHEKECYFIDFGQSIEPNYPNAFYFLHRDCVHITDFFRRLFGYDGHRRDLPKRSDDVPDIMSPEQLFKYITGFEFGDRMYMEELRQSYKKKPGMMY